MSRFGPIDIGAVRAKHAIFEREFEHMVDLEAKESADHIENHVYQAPLFHPRTGNLQKSTNAKVVKFSGHRRIVATNPAKYAASIDLGARPHVVTAKKARALRFASPKFWSIATRSPIWFLKSVHHPGNRPYKFLWRATYSGWRIAGEGMRLGMARLARKF